MCLVLIPNIPVLQLRKTRALSLFPVGLVTRTGISSPIVKNGKIVGFFDGWIANRRFPVDMAGFAVNIKTLKQVGKNWFSTLSNCSITGTPQAWQT